MLAPLQQIPRTGTYSLHQTPACSSWIQKQLPQHSCVCADLCLWGRSSWCRGKPPTTAHPGKGRGWRGQLKPAILISCHGIMFYIAKDCLLFHGSHGLLTSPLPRQYWHVKQNSLLTRQCSSSHGKHLLTRCRSWTCAPELSDQVVPQVWVPMSAAFPFLWAQPWSSVTSHQLLFDWVEELCPCSQVRKLFLTSKDRGLFLHAKGSDFLSLSAQSSHHLWQKDGWQQD